MTSTRLAVALAALLVISGLAARHAEAANDPPPTGGTVLGNWNVTEARAYTGVNITVDRGNLTIGNGASLTLDNVNLQFRMNYSGQNWIDVQKGGSLVVKNRSTVSSSNPDRHLYFRIRPGASAYLANSTFRDMGNSSNYNITENNGLYVASGNVSIEYCTFGNSSFGVFLDRVSPPVSWCGFYSIDYIGLCAYGSNSILTGNDFCGTYYGLSVNYFSNTSVSHCTFRENGKSGGGGAAVFSEYSGGRFHCNTIRNSAAGNGIYCYDSASPAVDNCTINTTANTAVYTDSRAQPRFVDCVISSKGNCAIYCIGSSSVEADRTVISSPDYIGVYATTFSIVRLANCTVLPSYYYSLYLARYSVATVSNTNIDARGYGVYCSASELDFQRVNITSSASIGMAVTGASTVDMERVSIVSYDTGMIASCDGRGAITMNQCSVNARNSLGMSVTQTSVWMFNCSVYSTYSYAFYSYDRGLVSCQNCTIATGSALPVIYFGTGGGSLYNFTNVMFDKYKVQFTEPTSELDMYWFLSISVVWQSFAPVEGAWVNVTDINGRVVLDGATDSRGEMLWQPVREYRRTQGGWYNDTSHDITALRNGVTKMERRAIRSNTNVRVILSDPDPPVVVMAFPTNGACIRTSAFEVCGTAEDYVSGVAKVDYRVDDGAWTPARGLEEWAFSVELPDGPHMLRARAADAAGSSREAAASIVVDTAISLEVSSPPEGALLNCSSVTVTGLAEAYSNVTANGQGGLVESDGEFSIGLVLGEGPQTISISARDAAGNVMVVERHVTVDTVPPALKVLAPVNGSTTTSRFVAVNGTVEVGARLSIGGRDCPAADGRFSAIVPLAEGQNQLAVSAADAAGNVNSTVVLVVSDTTAPRIGISAPADGSVVSLRVVGVSGETDGAFVTVGGSPATLNGSLFSADVPLKEGDNYIDVVARDIAGNQNLTTLHVVLDTRPPFLQVTSPAPGHITNIASLTVSGATEPGAAVTVNGQPATNSNGSVGTTLKLLPGDNILVIRAVDPAGNAAFANRTVVLDQTPPPLTVTQPSAGARTSEVRLTVKGSTDPGCTVTINGEPAAVDRRGKFSKDVTLEEGDNTLVVTSVDQGGNPTTRLVRVVRTGALSMKGSETPVLALGLAGGAVVGGLAGFLVAMRLKRRREPPAAPEEPEPGAYDVPEGPDADWAERSAPPGRTPKAAAQPAPLPPVPAAEPLEGSSEGEPRRRPGGELPAPRTRYSRESPRRSR